MWTLLIAILRNRFPGGRATAELGGHSKQSSFFQNKTKQNKTNISQNFGLLRIVQTRDSDYLLDVFRMFLNWFKISKLKMKGCEKGFVNWSHHPWRNKCLLRTLSMTWRTRHFAFNLSLKALKCWNWIWSDYSFS